MLFLFPNISNSIKVRFWACTDCVGSHVIWNGDIATCKKCGKNNKMKLIRDALLNVISKYAVPCEYYYDYYFMDGKIQDDCPDQEKLLKIIQDQCAGINSDISKILKMVNKEEQMPDTRYRKGVIETYSRLVAENKGGNPGDYVKSCTEFVDKHKEWHEENRWDFKPKEGFLEQIEADNG